MAMDTRLSPQTYIRDPYSISTDPDRLNLSVIHGYLEQAYWSEGIPREIVRRSLENSLCFGVYRGETQIGFARVVTDYVTFAYLHDVFVLEGHRDQGVGKWLIVTIRAHPALQGLRRWILATLDAHGLYAQIGFVPLQNPDRFMEINAPDIYRDVS